MPVLGDDITITVRLVGYKANPQPKTINANLSVIKIPSNSAAALTCSPTSFQLVQKGTQYVPSESIECTAAAASRARVRVQLATVPALANVTTAVSVKLPM
jgi:hypothetical protein